MTDPSAGVRSVSRGLSVRAFGPLEFQRDGVVVRLARRKTRELFLFVLLHRGRYVGTDAMIEALWEGRPPEHPVSAVRSYMSTIRNAIEGGSKEVEHPLVKFRDGAYSLDVDPSRIDLLEFERLAGRSELALIDGFSASALRDSDIALGLVRGEPLAEAADRAFAAIDIERLSDLRLHLRDARAFALLEMGDPARAVTDLLALNHQYPCRETTALLLIVGLYRAQRQVEAIERAAAFRRSLQSELGEQPDRGLRELETAVLNQDVALDDPGWLRNLVLPHWTTRTRTPTVRPRVGRSPTDVSARSLYGRDEAERELVARLRANSEVVIAGTVGCGTSVLANRVAMRLAEEEGATVVTVDVSSLADGSELRRVVRDRLAGLSIADEGRDHPALLVLDNGSTMESEAALVAAETVRAFPSVRVLRTSRRRDATHGSVFEIGPLPEVSVAAADPELLATSPAVALFAERAKLSRRSLNLGPANLRAIGRLCDKLDRLPLAIVLAADQSLVMEPAELEQLFADEPASVLTCHDYRRTERHQDLHSALSAAFGELTDLQKHVFLQLARVGGCIEIARDQEGSGSSGRTPTIATAVLESLAERSMVVVDRVGLSVRYRLLGTWQAFADLSALPT